MWKGISGWLGETHSSRFELRRHFFHRFFESELISEPGQAKIVAGGALAILISLSLIYTQAYYHKYLALGQMEDPRPFLQAELADILFVVTLAMVAMGLFTTLEWPSLFPSLRDYLTLAALPMRVRDVFEAKFTALLGFAALTTFAMALLPSVALPAVMAQGWDPHPEYQIAALFVSASLAGLFVFFSLVAAQGVLLNVVPVREFSRVSLAVQAFLLAINLAALPLVFSVPDLHGWMNARPAWAVWVPPLWFLGLDQVIAGHAESLAVRLAQAAFTGTGAAACAAVLTYVWSYRRHRTRVIESPAVEKTASRAWADAVSGRLCPNPRTLAVFGFIAKSLARSRQHRLILTAFAAIALAIISEGFAGLLFTSGRHVAVESKAFRQAAIAVPLAMSLFLLTGLRYLFRLPVELRANWVFRIHEPGNAVALLAGAETFLLVCGVFPVTLLSLPVEMALLGAGQGLAASALCLWASLLLVEILLFPLERIPFTSSYLPGQRPLIDVVMGYLVATAVYVASLSTLIRGALQSGVWTVALMALLAAAWWKARRVRLEARQIHHLGFEEVPEPAVQLLGIERD